MADYELDYEPKPAVPTRRQSVAAALNRISWMLLAVSILASVLVYHFVPARSTDPLAYFIDRAIEVGSWLNILGGGFAIVSLIMHSRLSSGLVLTLHILAFFICWPSIGYA